MQLPHLSILAVTSQFDPKDPTSTPVDLRQDTTQSTLARLSSLGDSGEHDLDGLNIGIPKVCAELALLLCSSSMVPWIGIFPH